MNIVEKLLKIDAGQLEMPKKTIKIFCKKIKQELEFEINAIDPERLANIQKQSLNIKKGDVAISDLYTLKTLIILEGCPVFKDKSLMQHFGVPTPKELIKKLLLSGEIDKLYNEIWDLNEFNEEKTDEEIKN